MSSVFTRRLALASTLALLASDVTAFDFTYSPPTQCDNLTVSWKGGSPPFQLFIAPFFAAPQNISIPSSAYDGNKGKFSVQLPIAASKQFLLSMSDATGFGTGGTSDVLTVGTSVSQASCNTTSVAPDFTFQANSALTQCRAFPFTAFDDAVQPVTITGLIPLGQQFTLHPPKGLTEFDWTANVAAGTNLAFILTDAKGRTGGTSNLLNVGQSGDNSCLNSSSPSSTANGPTATQTEASASQTPKVTSHSNAGAIAGGVIAALVVLSLIGCGVYFHLRRRRQQTGDEFYEKGSGSHGSDSSNGVLPTLAATRRSRRRTAQPLDLIPAQSTTAPLTPGDDYLPNPYVLPSETPASDGHSSVGVPRTNSARTPTAYSQAYQSTIPSVYSATEASHPPPTSPTSQSQLRPLSNPFSSAASSRKAAMAGVSNYVPTRFIVHRDADDVLSDADPDEVVELPPQYTDRRTSISGTAPEQNPPAQVPRGDSQPTS